MNNLVLGDDSVSYYETICGGSGAAQGIDGASGVHVHMTNTAITDPEILERRYPLRLHRFEIATGSGGHGKWRGGDGIIREIEFLKPLAVSFLAGHRSIAPRGADRGSEGRCGTQVVSKNDGVIEELPYTFHRQFQVGERLVIETPGGGGFGPPDPSDLPA